MQSTPIRESGPARFVSFRKYENSLRLAFHLLRRSPGFTIFGCLKLVPLVLLASVTVGVSVAGQDTTSIIGIEDHRFDEVRRKIREVVEAGHVPSMAVAVAQDGKIIWEEAFGWADRENREPANPHSIYGVGSISKTFTATGIMRLVERKAVDLDRPANDYLGRGKIRAFVGDVQRATVRRILSHRAGLPQHWQMFFSDSENKRPTMDETILRYGIIVNPPGERYQYANLDYGIAEQIIERVSGVPYESFMDREVFRPLGLTRTYVLVPPNVRPGTVKLYDWQGRVPYFDFDQRGAGAVYCSIHDLVRFGMFHLRNRRPHQPEVLTDATLEAMRRPEPVVPGDDPGVNYALGWATRDNQYGYRVDSHNGGQQGGSSDLRLVPEKNIVVAVLANTMHNLTYSIGEDVLAALLPDYKERWKRRDTSPPPPSPRFQPTDEFLGDWQGEIVTWQKSLPITLTFQPDGDVHVRLADQLVTLLDKVSYTDGNLSGTFNGTLPPPDIRRHPHRLQLSNLRIYDGVLGGAVLAIDTTARWEYGLPSWIWLKRK